VIRYGQNQNFAPPKNPISYGYDINITCFVIVLGYTQWSSWSTCPVSCNGGMHHRTRVCPPGVVCDPDEHGSSLRQSQPCASEACPGVWQNWESYGECSVSCGGGERTRSRTCLGGEVGGPGCEGSDMEQSSCGEEPCPGSWTVWITVGSCSVDCGAGKQQETRECDGGNIGGPGCVGEYEREIDCNLGDCIIQWAGWGAWGVCSRTCGAGTKTRTR